GEQRQTEAAAERGAEATDEGGQLVGGSGFGVGQQEVAGAGVLQAQVNAQSGAERGVGAEHQQVAVEGGAEAGSGRGAEGVGGSPGRGGAELGDILAGNDAQLVAAGELGAEHFGDGGGHPSIGGLAAGVLEAEHGQGAAAGSGSRGRRRAAIAPHHGG